MRACISPVAPVAKCVRATYDSTVRKEDMSNGGGIAQTIGKVVHEGYTTKQGF